MPVAKLMRRIKGPGQYVGTRPSPLQSQFPVRVLAKQLPLRVLRHLDQRVLPTCQDLVPREGVRTLPTVRMLSIHLVALGGLECLIRHGLHPFARHSSRTRSCRATTPSSVSLALAEHCPIDLRKICAASCFFPRVGSVRFCASVRSASSRRGQWGRSYLGFPKLPCRVTRAGGSCPFARTLRLGPLQVLLRMVIRRSINRRTGGSRCGTLIHDQYRG
ncbi:hypothetical protein V8E53_010913 [Lactarius tabidus]